MKKLLAVFVCALVAAPVFAQDSEWVSLWDGKTFNGWKKAGENPDSFRIEDGAIISNGPRCHLYYVGDVHGAYEPFVAILRAANLIDRRDLGDRLARCLVAGLRHVLHLRSAANG